jgi:hypothetical protein
MDIPGTVSRERFPNEVCMSALADPQLKCPPAIKSAFAVLTWAVVAACHFATAQAAAPAPSMEGSSFIRVPKLYTTHSFPDPRHIRFNHVLIDSAELVIIGG